MPVRAWRDDLTVIRESLSYARAILAADVAILSDAATQREDCGADRVAEVPNELFSSPGEDQWPSGSLVDWAVSTDLDDLDVDIDEGLFVRTDHLLARPPGDGPGGSVLGGRHGRVPVLVEEQLAC